MVYFIFDVMCADGRDVRRLPLPDRKQVLKDLLTYGGPLRFTVHRTRTAQAYWDEALRWAGRADREAGRVPYTAGRSGTGSSSSARTARSS